MARLTKEELKKVMDKYKVNTLWSWSKIDTFLTSPYEYYLKYVLHKKEDKDNCSYATLGSITHNTIEDFYSGKIEYHEMIEQFEDGWLTAIDIANLKTSLPFICIYSSLSKEASANGVLIGN